MPADSRENNEEDKGKCAKRKQQREDPVNAKGPACIHDVERIKDSVQPWLKFEISQNKKVMKLPNKSSSQNFRTRDIIGVINVY